MDVISLIIGAVIGLLIGAIAGKLIFGQSDKQKEIAEKEAEIIIKDAKREGEAYLKSQQVNAKEEFLKRKNEIEQQRNQRLKKIQESEKKLRGKEQSLSQQRENFKNKEDALDKIREQLNEQVIVVTKKKEDLEKAHDSIVSRLEQVAKLTAEEAKAELIENLKEDAKAEGMAYKKEIIDEAKLKATKEAKKIVLQTIQRTAAEQTIENTVSVFNLNSDDQKGQIIGREGRNIRALEAATGVELIVDDTPEAVIISGFDSVRREVARLSLQRLTTDGRIHPARIEEIVRKTKKQMEEHILEIGERTVIELGINGLNPNLIRIIGRMRFRSSYGQNLLQHSKEVARLCATMAAEMGINPKLAKRAGLLHDIGKVPEEETDLSHALLGAKLCEKHGESAAVVNAVGAHHDEMEMKYLISPIIQACDAISGARPGARREIMESYLQRIKELEQLALSYDGVQKAYAIQAGRELRVIVESEKVSDSHSEELSFKISEKIQDEMQYPGHIKVTVIREKRAVSFAR